MGGALCCNIVKVDIFGQFEPREEGMGGWGGEGERKIGRE